MLSSLGLSRLGLSRLGLALNILQKLRDGKLIMADSLNRVAFITERVRAADHHVFGNIRGS